MASWKNSLSRALEMPLPGVSAHKIMAPSYRFAKDDTIPTKDAKESSVLILIYPIHRRLYIPFIQRHEYKGAHSGQISLPGGKKEIFDKDNWATALRETREELGIDIDKVEYIGALSPVFIPISNFLVHPFVGYIAEKPNFKPNDFEVKEILQISIHKLFTEADSQHFTTKTVLNQEIKAPCFKYEDKKIWGATAMILSELNIIFREHLPRWANSLHSYNAHIARGLR